MVFSIKDSRASYSGVSIAAIYDVPKP